MRHLFDVEIAKAYGMDVAVFLENISFWIIKNQANKEHFHDGRYWTYNTLDAFTVIFPYLSKKQIRRIIDKSFKKDLIVKGNYNQIGYDRTIWYSLSDRGHALFNMELCPNGKIEMPKWADRKDQKGTPIPYINHIQTHIKDKDKSKPKKQASVEPCIDPYVLKPIIEIPSWLNKDLWEEFKQHRKTMKKPMTELSQKKTINQLEKMMKDGEDVEAVINQSIANGWQGIFPNKSQGGVNGKGRSVVGQNGFIEAPRNWATEQWAILKEGCGLSRDADLSKVKGIVPSEIWDSLPDPRRDFDSSTALDIHVERDFG